MAQSPHPQLWTPLVFQAPEALWGWLRPLLMPDLLSSLTHVVPKTTALDTAPHKPPSQSPSPETLIRGTSQHSLALHGLTLPFLELLKPLSSLLPKLPQCGVRLCISVCPPRSEALEDDHIYSTPSLQHLVWCLQRPLILRLRGCTHSHFKQGFDAL